MVKTFICEVKIQIGRLIHQCERQHNSTTVPFFNGLSSESMQWEQTSVRKLECYFLHTGADVWLRGQCCTDITAAKTTSSMFSFFFQETCKLHFVNLFPKLIKVVVQCYPVKKEKKTRAATFLQILHLQQKEENKSNKTQKQEQCI